MIATLMVLAMTLSVGLPAYAEPGTQACVHPELKANWTIQLVASPDRFLLGVTLVCTTCGMQIQSWSEPSSKDNAQITIDPLPTCEQEGQATVYAHITYDGVEYASTALIVALPCTGHIWAEPVWKWAADNSTADFQRTCKNDSSHKDTTTVTATVSTVPATCDTAGSATYTVSKDGVTDTKTDTIPALGHDWADPVWTWEADNLTADVTFTCKNDPNHKETTTVDATVETIPATCEEDGSITHIVEKYDCSDSKLIETIERLGHDWTEPEWTWAEDNLTATFQRACKNDPEHKESSKVDATAKTIPATCDTAGSITYTVAKDDITATKTVDVAATGHDWTDPVFAWAVDNMAADVKLTCKNDPTHTKSSVVASTEEITKPTCEKAGKRVYTVTVEGFTDTRNVKIKATGHKWNSKDVCSTCKKSKPVTHTHKKSARDVIEPTCTSRGYTSYVCTSCNAWFRGDYTAALGHDYGDWVSTGTGKNQSTCACGHVRTRSCVQIRAMIGDEEYVTCLVCGDHGDDVSTAVIGSTIRAVEANALPKLGQLIVRSSILPLSEPAMTLFTVGYEKDGQILPFNGLVEVSIPLNTQDAFTLTLLSELTNKPVTAVDEVIPVGGVAMPYLHENGMLTFRIDAPSLFALSIVQ